MDEVLPPVSDIGNETLLFMAELEGVLNLADKTEEDETGQGGSTGQGFIQPQEDDNEIEITDIKVLSQKAAVFRSPVFARSVTTSIQRKPVSKFKPGMPSLLDKKEEPSVKLFEDILLPVMPFTHETVEVDAPVLQSREIEILPEQRIEVVPEAVEVPQEKNFIEAPVSKNENIAKQNFVTETKEISVEKKIVEAVTITEPAQQESFDLPKTIVEVKTDPIIQDVTVEEIVAAVAPLQPKENIIAPAKVENTISIPQPVEQVTAVAEIENTPEVQIAPVALAPAQVDVAVADNVNEQVAVLIAENPVQIKKTVFVVKDIPVVKTIEAAPIAKEIVTELPPEEVSVAEIVSKPETTEVQPELVAAPVIAAAEEVVFVQVVKPQEVPVVETAQAPEETVFDIAAPQVEPVQEIKAEAVIAPVLDAITKPVTFVAKEAAPVSLQPIYVTVAPVEAKIVPIYPVKAEMPENAAQIIRLKAPTKTPTISLNANTVAEKQVKLDNQIAENNVSPFTILYGQAGEIGKDVVDPQVNSTLQIAWYTNMDALGPKPDVHSHAEPHYISLWDQLAPRKLVV